jgi:GNAT superfamily N-acetyltransferase
LRDADGIANQIVYRQAHEGDILRLAEMRWAFRAEEGASAPTVDKAAFFDACANFLREGLSSGRWAYRVAEHDGLIISHMFVQRIAKVPKPGRLADAFGYLTNVYTEPSYRGRGIGSALMAHVVEWAKAQDLELLVVWPSQPSREFYRRAGFCSDNEIMELILRG